MGADTRTAKFTDADFATFRNRVIAQYRQLEGAPVPPFTGTTLGFETEICFVDSNGQPLFAATDILRTLSQGDSVVRYKPEVIRDQVEAETPHGLPFNFATLEQLLQLAVDEANAAAVRRGGLALPIGTLPTLTHLGTEHLSPNPRYAGLHTALHKHYGPKITLPAGAGPGSHSTASIGATTSFQLHVTVPVPEFADYYNAMQLVSALVLAAAVNAPLPFGRPGWTESRIPMLEQLTGGRASFGRRWLGNYYEPFQHNQALAILLPECAPRPQDAPFWETDLLMSTVWPWNRTIRHPARIETRFLPAGTPADMAANGRFLVGLMHLYAERMAELRLRQLPFELARANFYAAAQYGLDAKLSWPVLTNRGLEIETNVPVRHLILEHQEPAEAALLKAGGSRAGADHHLRVVHDRVTNGQTGARWQMESFRALLRQHRGNQAAALAELALTAAQLTAIAEPVHTWALAV